MVFEYSDFTVLTDNLTTYIFGNETVLSIFLFMAFLLYMTVSGVPLTISATILTPLIAAFNIAGWLGNTDWVFNLALIAIAITFSTAATRIYSR